METSNDETFPEISSDEKKEIPELCVENPCVIENVLKEEKEVIDAEEVNLIYKPPRFFRRSLINKTIKLFEANDENKKPKKKRPLRQK